MLDENNIAFLSSTLTFWNKLSASEKNTIINNTHPVIYSSGNTIHSGKNDCVGVLLIKNGTLRTYLLSEEGREITLYRLYKGDVCMLSASCLIKNITFDVHIDAECKTEILLINSALFLKLSEENVFIENFSLKTTVSRFSDVMWSMEQILFMSFDKRLAIFLLGEISKATDNEHPTDTINLTHEQIAKYMGSAREVVSRMLKYFSSEGIVLLSRGGVKIIDKKKLEKLT